MAIELGVEGQAMVTGWTQFALPFTLPSQALCGGEEEINGVWYSFIPSATGWLLASISSTHEFLMMQKNHGCDPDHLSCFGDFGIASSNDATGLSSVQINVQEGAEYLFLVWSVSATGTEDFTFSLDAPPPNDSCEDAVVIELDDEGQAVVTGSTQLALPDPAQGWDYACATPNTAGVWYLLTPIAEGWLTASVSSTHELLMMVKEPFYGCGNINCTVSAFLDEDTGLSTVEIYVW